jgi:2,5-dihydroxypyridine 5,6-dioxygenase
VLYCCHLVIYIIENREKERERVAMNDLIKKKLFEGAKKITDICLGIKAGEQVLIITDYGIKRSIAEALKEAVSSSGAFANILIIEPGEKPGEEPTKLASGAMKEADVIIAATTKTLWHSNAATNACNNGARLLTLTECTEKTLTEGAIEADFIAFQPIIKKLIDILNNGKMLHVTAPGGTDVYLSILGRETMSCSGVCLSKGMKMGFPDVEVYIAPIESSINGTIIIDASIASIGLLNSPIKMKVENGRVVSIIGGREAEELEKILLSTNNKNSYIVSEFAIGLNDKAQVIGNIIEDEGVYGTGHFALGNNLHFGGENNAPMHIDMVYWKPTVYVDGEAIMIDGELVPHIKNCEEELACGKTI